MAVGIKNLKNAVDSRLLAGGLSSIAQCQLDNAQAILNGQSLVITVPSLSSLPLPENNEGLLVYVNDINEYRFSNGSEWTDDFSSSVENYTEVHNWGINCAGEFGNGTINRTPDTNPKFNSFVGTNWCAVESILYRSSAIKTDGTLWSWGTNVFGVFANGNSSSCTSPVREICSATNWCGINVSVQHSTAIKTDGTIWSWGQNNCGQLGDGTTVNKCSPVREISSSTNWCCLDAINSFSTAIKSDGTLWSWGWNLNGRLGDGTTLNRCSPVREISLSTNWCTLKTGFSHATAIKSDGSLWSWGCGFSGRLADGTTINKCSPVREISSSTNWNKIGAGEFGTVSIKTDGTLWAWGSNFSGRLGDGTTVNKCSPVREASSSTNWCFVGNSGCANAAIKSDNTLWLWGFNSAGLLGDGTTIDKCSPVQEITSSVDWCFFSLGCTNAVGLKLKTKGFI